MTVFNQTASQLSWVFLGCMLCCDTNLHVDFSSQLFRQHRAALQLMLPSVECCHFLEFIEVRTLKLGMQ